MNSIRLGLRANLSQFSLLVLVNAFVGAMAGLERAILPLIAEGAFGIASQMAALSFIFSFGLVKALANVSAGRLCDTYGRKRILLLGWVAGIPVPLLLMWAPTWNWIVTANLLLGINQGLCWSAAVIMKIDLAGPKARGLAMSLNEFAGYVAVAASALATGYIAATYGLRPQPFYLGVVLVVLGFLVSVFAIRETREHALLEGRALSQSVPTPTFKQIFFHTSWQDKALFSCSQAGMINNLNDGMAWGLLPLFFTARGLALADVAILSAVYPAVWGVTQLATGSLSDRFGRKGMIVAGMWVQAAGIWIVAAGSAFKPWLAGSILLGLGTAMVYPTLLAAVSDATHPNWRASAVGVYRLWRDSGYAVGALVSGLTADFFGIQSAIILVGFLTFASGALTAAVMYETLKRGPL